MRVALFITILFSLLGSKALAQTEADQKTRKLVDLSEFAVKIYNEQTKLDLKDGFDESLEAKLDRAISENDSAKIYKLIEDSREKVPYVEVYEKTAHIFELDDKKDTAEEILWLNQCANSGINFRAHKCAISLSSIHLFNLDINKLIDAALNAVEIAENLEKKDERYWYLNRQSNEYLLVGFIYDRNIDGTSQIGRLLAQAHLDKGVKYKSFILINNIAHIANKELGPESALKVLEPVSQIVENLEDKDREVAFYALGKNHLLAGNYEKALLKFSEYEKVKSRADIETSANAYLALLHANLANTSKAKEYYEKSWPSVKDNIESNRGITVLKAKKKIAILEDRLSDALRIDEELDRVGDFLEDKAFSANREKLSKSLQVANERRQRETDKLQFEAELSAQQAKASRTQLILSLWALVFLVGLVTYVFRSYRKEQRLNAEIKGVNTKLEKKNKELHIAHANVTNTFERLKVAHRQAMAGQEAKQKFIGVVGHELRTPLNPIINLAEVLEARESDPKDKALLKAIKNAGKRLHIIVENMLAISSASKDSQVFIEMVDVVYEATTVVEEFVPDIRERNVQLKDEGKYVNVNVFRHPDFKNLQVSNKIIYRSIIRNLFDNAVKFTTDGEISLHLNLRDKKRGFQLEVRDTGIGMDVNKIEEFMRPFEQAEMGLGRSHEGAGLGLAVVHKYCEQLGAKMLIKSTVGKGTRIIIDFPEPAHESETGKLLKVA